MFEAKLTVKNGLWQPSEKSKAVVRQHPAAADLLASRCYDSRTIFCAAGFKTPLWQQAVAETSKDKQNGV